MPELPQHGPRRVPPPADDGGPDAQALIAEVAKGDERAFEQLYELIAGSLFGLVQRIVRDAAQSEEVAQEALVEVWRTATHYRPERGSVLTWVLTVAHRKAVDRVRSAQAGRDREARVGARDQGRPFDEVSESVTTRWEQRQVRRCLSTLTELQRESVLLTYYRGYTYRETAGLLEAPASTIKTRLRDGLIRLRDCLGVGR
ncbi:MAG: ECF RNA polymerase sigma factor SigK [Saccharopolyspora sp.]|uniref:ECF RNA polymerase sigma factor SigK n=1 Tax=Saccharopolyspora TaxID=1835 RepID=UPI00190C76C0|nr:MULTISPECIES: ECF RNA polymerase sigma factor SigK [unclassified Saccharopolyspora]MBK0868097.1 ECF RNA polymerase sigma factor SigK [Saccharopolyspora sp. HNM0986]MBQ6644182.1 ECF RNA polymerase sigma factor SigK [Saccharopolyspora sp.]